MIDDQDDQKVRTDRAGRSKSLGCATILLFGLYTIAGCAEGLQTPAYRSQPRTPEVSQAAAARPVESTPVRAPGGQWQSDRYTDLPIPRDFEFETEQSFIFVQEGIRNADLKYVGPLSVEEIIRFYRDEMPSNGWQFIRMSGVRMKTMTFTNGGEVCEIIIMSMEPGEIQQGNEWQRPSQTHLHIKLNAY